LSNILSILTIIYIFLLFVTYKVRGITVLWLFNFGIFVFYHVGFWSLKFQTKDIYFLSNTSESIEHIVPDIIIFTIIAICVFLIMDSRGVKPTKIEYSKKEMFFIRNIILMLTAIIILILVPILPFIDYSHAPLFNIGSFSAEEMAIYRRGLFQGPILELMNVPIYLLLYTISPTLLFFYGLGFHISKIVLFAVFSFGILTLAKTFFVLNMTCFFVGWWFKRGGLLPIIIAQIIIPTVFFVIVYCTYLTDTNRSFIEVYSVLLTRIIQVPIALTAVYKEIFYFNEGIRSSYWYTLFFGGVKVPIQQIAGYYLMPNAVIAPNAACGILGSAYPNVPKELHWLYFTSITIFIAFVSYVVSQIKNYAIRVVGTVIIGSQSLFILLTDPLVAFNSYGFLWSGLFVSFYVYGMNLMKGCIKRQEQ